MAGILTPEEIQDLLRHPSATGPVRHLWTEETAAYDLLQGGDKAQEQMQQIQALQAELPTLLATDWSMLTGKTLTAAAGDYEFLPMSDLLAQTATDTTLVAHWREAALALDGLFGIDRAFFFSCYATQLGGDGGAARVGELTAFEKTFARRLMESLCGVFAKLWQAQGVGETHIEQLLEQQEQLAQLGWTNDAYRVTLTLSEGDALVGTVTVVLPRECARLLSADGDKGGGAVRSTATWKEAAVWALNDDIPLPMAVQVEMGLYPSSVREIMSLRPGDVLVPALHAQYPVAVRGTPLFLATLGTLQDRKAIQIVKKITGGDSHG